MDELNLDDPVPLEMAPSSFIQVCAFLEHVLIRVSYTLWFLFCIYATSYSVTNTVSNSSINLQIIIIFSMMFKMINYNMGCKVSKDKRTIMILTLLLFFSSNIAEIISSFYMFYITNDDSVYYLKMILGFIIIQSIISILWSIWLTIGYIWSVKDNGIKIKLYLIQLKNCRKQMEQIYE